MGDEADGGGSPRGGGGSPGLTESKFLLFVIDSRFGNIATKNEYQSILISLVIIKLH